MIRIVKRRYAKAEIAEPNRAAARRHSRDEIARRGHAMYTRSIRRKVAGEKMGRVVAIDIKTGDYEVADDLLNAAITLRARQPKAEIWLEKIGYPTFAKMRSSRDHR